MKSKILIGLLGCILGLGVWHPAYAVLNGSAITVSDTTLCNNGVITKVFAGTFATTCGNGWSVGEVPPALPASFGPQSSTFAVDNGFDFAERFDGLQDWAADLTDAQNVGENTGDATRMPRLADGSVSAWTYYSKYGTSTDTTPWITNYGDNRSYKGKSAVIDLSGDRGPSRLGLLATVGYKEQMNYFFMVNIPKNEFPTGGSTDTYIEGEQYTGERSWKFMTFNYGCETISCWDGAQGGAGYSPIWHQITHIKLYSYHENQATLGSQMFIKVEDQRGDQHTAYGGEHVNSSFDARFGDWVGIEWQIEQDNIACKTKYTMWLYDKDGTAYQIMTPENTRNGYYATWDTKNCGTQYSWDFFFHGGNNSGTFSWGPTMEAPYYIDDVIIDSSRIGPRYFTAIAGE